MINAWIILFMAKKKHEYRMWILLSPLAVGQPLLAVYLERHTVVLQQYCGQNSKKKVSPKIKQNVGESSRVGGWHLGSAAQSDAQGISFALKGYELLTANIEPGRCAGEAEQRRKKKKKNCVHKAGKASQNKYTRTKNSHSQQCDWDGWRERVWWRGEVRGEGGRRNGEPAGSLSDSSKPLSHVLCTFMLHYI